MSDELQHYGIKRRSGRYPWGSGKDPQRSKDILSVTSELRTQGMSEKEIADSLGMTTTQLRNERAWATKERKEFIMDSVTSMKKRGMSNTAIAAEITEKYGLPMSEGSVRNYISQKDKVLEKQVDNVADELVNSVSEHTYLDVGPGVELQMGVSRAKVQAAISALEAEGYVQHEIYIKRLDDPTRYTTIKVLTKETDLEVVKMNSDKIRPVEAWSDDGGSTFERLRPPQMVDWDRIDIRYAEQGGSDKDGVIELRRNVDDLDMGGSSYAQVRIGVADSHYLKGMVVYADDMPSGKDMVFYTNKKEGTPREEVLKPLKENVDNRFGATIARQKGALNIVNEEGDWDTWQSTLSSQFLSKQPANLVKERLDATYSSIKKEFDEINSLTNPVVRKHLMEAYSDGLESKAASLKVQGLPRTKGHVLLPFPTMNPNEVYAPNYKDGERVVLIRYPHGGIFELPELTVNNKGPAKSVLKNAMDAIGIHPSVAQKLSGADFDGDTVYVIPNPNKKIKTSRSLKELKNFDPSSYKVDNPPKIRTQLEMGKASNLITDMTIKGATQSELARAVKHSMVVIDAEKHGLDYRKSASDNAISALKKKYQSSIHPLTGAQSQAAATIVSRSSSKIMTESVNKSGKVTKVKQPMMSLIDDAYKLSSGTAVENLYAGYANKLKALQNTSAKIAAAIKPIKYNKEAAKTYSKEVASLGSKLKTALLNAPRERQAQILAANTYYKNLSYDMTPDQKKKLKAQSTASARVKVGAKKTIINITPLEWEAIQAKAISNHRLTQILNNADMDKVKKLATPKPSGSMTAAKVQRAKQLLSNGYTYAEVADAIGVSPTTIRTAIE